MPKPLIQTPPLASSVSWNQEDLDALTICIEGRWTYLQTHNHDEDYDDDLPECQLCVLDDSRMRQDELLEDCQRCIIKKDSGYSQCNNTVYIKWRWANGKEQLEYAATMLAYLKDLKARMLASPDQKEKDYE